MKVKVLFTILFIIFYFWSSKINEEFIGFLRHSEDYENWILDSDVCALGKISFYLWTIVMIFGIWYKLNTNALLGLMFITVFLTLMMNKPLFIRSIPAFLFLFLAIRY